MADETRQDLRKVTVHAALTLCGQSGWRSLRMRDIAQEMGESEQALRDIFPDKNSILRAFYDDLEHQSLALAEDMPDESVRDRLFAMMMERLDLAAPYRDAIQKMLDEGMPKLALCRSKRWLDKLLEASDAGSSPLTRPIQQLALAAIWAMVLPVWLSDSSDDLSGTMATLDTQLGNAESAQEMLDRLVPKF